MFHSKHLQSSAKVVCGSDAQPEGSFQGTNQRKSNKCLFIHTGVESKIRELCELMREYVSHMQEVWRESYRLNKSGLSA